MERESFEDDATAALMNEAFVSIKVDREERPDLDGIYMDAVQAMNGHGGWPLSAFLTPEGRPFYAGTYFPPEPAHGMPSFRQVLSGIAEAWRDRRDELVVQAGAGHRGHRALGRTRRGRRATDRRRSRTDALDQLRRTFDRTMGRLRGRAEVPPAHDPGVRAPPRAARFAGRDGDAGDHAGSHGGGRDLRPAGRRLRPVRDGRAPGTCRTSRRCSTTTPSCSSYTSAPGR